MELDDEAAAEGNRRIKPIATRVQFESFRNLGEYETVKLLDRSSRWEVVFFEVVYSDAVVARVRPNRVYARPAASLCLYPLHDLGPKPRKSQNRRKPRKPRKPRRNPSLPEPPLQPLEDTGPLQPGDPEIIIIGYVGTVRHPFGGRGF